MSEQKKDSFVDKFSSGKRDPQKTSLADKFKKPGGAASYPKPNVPVAPKNDVAADTSTDDDDILEDEDEEDEDSIFAEDPLAFFIPDRKKAAAAAVKKKKQTGSSTDKKSAPAVQKKGSMRRDGESYAQAMMRKSNNCIFLVKGFDNNRPAWHYCYIYPENQKKFINMTQGKNAGCNTISIRDYGEAIKSGWGEEPPEDVKAWMQEKHNGS